MQTDCEQLININPAEISAGFCYACFYPLPGTNAPPKASLIILSKYSFLDKSPKSWNTAQNATSAVRTYALCFSKMLRSIAISCASMNWQQKVIASRVFPSRKPCKIGRASCRERVSA